MAWIPSVFHSGRTVGPVDRWWRRSCANVPALRWLLKCCTPFTIGLWSMAGFSTMFFHCAVHFFQQKQRTQNTHGIFRLYTFGLNVYLQYNKLKYSIHGSYYWNMRQQKSPVTIIFHSFPLLVGSFPQVGMKVKTLWNHHPAYFFEKLQRFSASGDVRRKIPQNHSVATLRRWDSSFGHWPRQGLRRISMSVEGGGQIFSKIS